MSIAASLSDTAYPAPTVRLRLTRRGRRLLVVLASAPVVVGLVLVAVFGAGSAVASGTASSSGFQYVTVQAGQSLWGIAESLAPNADPRDVIAEISSLNQLHGSAVQPGQRLAIPADLVK